MRLLTKRPIVLVIYYWRGEWPMRLWERAHIAAWARHARSRVVGVNIAYPLPVRPMRQLRPDLILYHATALSARYRAHGFERLERTAETLAQCGAVRLACPLDEHLDTDRLETFLHAAEVNLVLTPAEPKLWSLLYENTPARRLRKVLTGYLDPTQVAWMRRRKTPLSRRPLALGYRAEVQSWTGHQGLLKREIGDRAAGIAHARGLPSDISTSVGDRLAGRAWFKLLLRSRAVLGVEGGASTLDRSGEVRRALSTGTEPVLLDQRNFVLQALSPRHLEAAAAGAGQILVEGHYSGVLEPNRHYLPVRGDFSDLAEAIEAAQDLRASEAMVRRAHEDLVASGQYTWLRAVRDLEAELLGV